MEGSAHMARGTMFDLLRGSASSNLPPREALAAVAHLPALIIAWEGDTIHPLASAQELHRLLPESELIIVNSLAELAGAGERKRAFLATLARRAG
jgi:pimeloyl-ACP methyl ester carboxylesterase